MTRKRLRSFCVLFCIGGGCYNLIEILWRGHSHWSMFFVGGSCFHLIGKIGKRLKGRSLALIGTACSAAVTVVEYVSGCLVNLHWKLDVWNYSKRPFNLHGQVCLLYSVLWGVLSLLAVPLYKLLENRLMMTRRSSSV